MTSAANRSGAGAIMPRMSLRQVDGVGRVSWNQGTMASVVFAPHLGPCAACAGYVEELVTAASDLGEWATRALVLIGPECPLATTPAPGVFLLDDSAGAGRASLGLGDDQAVVLQADRWGAVYQVESIRGTASHDGLPAGRELVALAQFIDIQCPECEVPSKEWLSASPFPLG